jgi:hypothetical protein
MGDPYAVLGHPNHRGTAMADGALRRLAGGTRHIQRDLQILASAWWTPTSCFVSHAASPHAKPSVSDPPVLFPYLARAEIAVASAAFAALRRFALVCSRGVYSSLPPSLWAISNTTAVVAACFSSPHAGPRLGASSLVREYPSDSFVDPLRAALEDPLFTVRWRAVCALSQLAPTSALGFALARSQPQGADPSRFPDYAAALEALHLLHDQLPSQGAG